MKNSTFLILLLILSINTYAQGERTLISGMVKCDGAELENIHILNKNSKKGAITNLEGGFKIEAQEKDTLIVTGIQFHYIEVPITNKHLNNKIITIELLQKMNELEEVKVSHNLTGNMSVDAHEVKIVKNTKDDAINFNNIELNLVSVKWDDASRSRTSSDSQLMPHMNPNLLAIAGIILKPIAKEVSKIGKTKRNIKKYDLRRQEKINSAFENLRTEYGDVFFIKTLKIPANHIEEFISTCLQKGMGNLYADDKKIEIIDMFLSESTIYLKTIKHDE